MRQWGFLAVALLSCYRAPQSNEACTITCSPGGDCPGDLACEGGFCVARGQVCRPSFVEVSAGTGFACAIDDVGDLWCWGSNNHHQVSPAEQASFALATRVQTTSDWQAVDAGGEHACGIANGRLSCWGKNDRGQAPLEIAVTDGPSAWTHVAAGVRQTCAIGDRKLWCWGANGNGQLGDGTLIDRDAPTAVMTTLGDWLAIATGDTHTCAISESTGVHCWGAGTPVPTAIGMMATSIAVSANAACATTSDGELWCWGSNANGELGESNTTLASSSVPVRATATTGWTSVSGSIDAFCGTRDQVVCWGSTVFGGLGSGLWTQSRAFVTVPSTTGATKISLGWNENYDLAADTLDLTLACALVGSDIACWGDNRFGQLAQGAATMALAPARIAGDPVFTDLQVGLSHGCGVGDGTVSCWGSTELGAATAAIAGTASRACTFDVDCDVAAPRPINFFSTSATDVALGAYHSCALHGSAITCWGDNSARQLITNDLTPRERLIPAPGGAAWSGIVQTGRLGQCAIYKSGMLDATACWGFVLAQRMNATPIAALNGAVGYALGSTPAGVNFDCILDATGALQCQGDNSFGQYGNGTTTSVATLMPVTPARTYAAIATNTNSPTLCAVRPDAGVECWGNNDRGQTGSSTPTSTLAPNPLPELAQCTAIAVGRLHACAICDNEIRCWGDNRFGQLGIGTRDDDVHPVSQPVVGLPAGTWVQLVAGARFTCARNDAGTSVCWGFDPHAGLGNGARSANLPITVRATPPQ